MMRKTFPASNANMADKADEEYLHHHDIQKFPCKIFIQVLKNSFSLGKHFQVQSKFISCFEFVKVRNIPDHSISQSNYNKNSSFTHYQSLISVEETVSFYLEKNTLTCNFAETLREDPRATTSFMSLLVFTRMLRHTRESGFPVFRFSSSSSLSRKDQVLCAKKVDFENCMFK